MGTLPDPTHPPETMATTSPTQTFRPLRRGYQVVQGGIYLLISVACIYQSALRYGVQVDKFWNSWWFFALLSLAFLYLTVEAFYKIFLTRLVFTPDEVIQYDFPKTTHTPWSDIQRIGEISFKGKKQDFGLTLKDAALEKDGILAMPFIPLTPYFSNWNESPLKQWLKERKPHLLK